jgi:hypothetical protein
MQNSDSISDGIHRFQWSTEELSIATYRRQTDRITRKFKIMLYTPTLLIEIRTHNISGDRHCIIERQTTLLTDYLLQCNVYSGLREQFKNKMQNSSKNSTRLECRTLCLLFAHDTVLGKSQADLQALLYITADVANKGNLKSNSWRQI